LMFAVPNSNTNGRHTCLWASFSSCLWFDPILVAWQESAQRRVSLTQTLDRWTMCSVGLSLCETIRKKTVVPSIRWDSEYDRYLYSFGIQLDQALAEPLVTEKCIILQGILFLWRWTFVRAVMLTFLTWYALPSHIFPLSLSYPYLYLCPSSHLFMFSSWQRLCSAYHPCHSHTYINHVLSLRESSNYYPFILGSNLLAQNPNPSFANEAFRINSLTSNL
jgi:hypothetical protein